MPFVRKTFFRKKFSKYLQNIITWLSSRADKFPSELMNLYLATEFEGETELINDLKIKSEQDTAKETEAMYSKFFGDAK